MARRGKGTKVWKHYATWAVVALLALVFLYCIVAPSEDSSPVKSKVKAAKAKPAKALTVQEQVASLESQLISLASALQKVGKQGSSEVLAQIAGFSADAENAVKAAQEVDVETLGDEGWEQRKTLLQAGLDKRGDWLAALAREMSRVQLEKKAAEDEINLDMGSQQELHTDTLPAFVGKNEHVLVMFYAPWCPHCKTLAPVLDEAAGVLKDVNVAIAKVDATKERPLAELYGIERYPHMVWFKKGKHYSVPDKLVAGKDPKAFVDWCTARTELPYAQLGTEADLQVAADQAGHTAQLVAFVGTTASSGFPEWESAAEDMRDKMVFVHVVDETEKEGRAKMFSANQVAEVLPAGGLLSALKAKLPKAKVAEKEEESAEA